FSSISYRFSKSNKNNLCGFVSSCERIIQVKKDENLIRISHFPSNTILKGTRYVLSAKDIINRENVVFNIERLSNDEVLNRLNETHILVNQFGSGYGLLAVEAMARGCVIVSRIADWFNNEYPEHPVLHCEAEELVSVLDDLINNPAKIIEIGKKSIAYYNKFHSPEAVGNYYKRVLNLN
ncbi:MAG: hypothetical protein JXC36_09355, partial [Candidatus Atribacteria bacterium]|nr:hypothetical protein [Candidatus Atribacteria bacterium]